MNMTLGPKPDDSQPDSQPDDIQPGAMQRQQENSVNLRVRLDAADARIVRLESMLSKTAKDVNAASALKSRAARLEADIYALQTSTSWRVTAPLRAVSRMVRAVRFAIGTVRQQAQREGGYGKVLSRVVRTLRHEGVAGLRWRIDRLRTGVADSVLSNDAYDAWIEQYDTLLEPMLDKARVLMESFELKPLISIVVPAYNSDERFLTEMVQSVRNQIYPNWELCIADDASPDPKVRAVLEREMARDPRVKVVFRETNGHISEASNSALSVATGDFIALLDHDDVLPSHALFMVVRYINLRPTARMFYSDEDKLTDEGRRTTPYFKSDWNPELFLTQNMFSHLGVFDAALVREAGGFRKGFEGSQDHDLTLRCLEIAGNDQVIHIPHVLYHWRMSPGSTAGSSSEKPYAVLAAIRAVDDHLRRKNVSATVDQAFEGLGILRVRYALPKPTPLVSIMIPTRDGVELLRQCIDSVIEKTIYENYEIIVVDNGSEKPETLTYFESFRYFDNVRVIRDDSPFNFSALNNHAASEAKGEYLCLLNNDIEVISPDWLDEMVGIASQPGNGAVGAALWYPNDTLQHGGVLIGLGGVAGHMHHKLKRGHFGYFGRAVTTQNLSAVTAACLVIRKSIYDELGGFDEGLAVAFNDVDFCLRVREAGYRNVWTPHAQLYHHESASRGSDMDPDKYERFVKEVRWMENRWGSKLGEDPAYNPNLTFDTTVPPFALAEPPRLAMLD